MRSSRLLPGLFVAAILAGGARAQAPAAPDPVAVAAQGAFEALPEAERKAIQNDLIWAGHFSGAVSGSFGPLTLRGINALKATTRGKPDGVLNAGERRALAEAAAKAREAAGFRLIADERTGVRIGVPTKLLPKRDATPSGGSRWQSEDGKVTLDLSAGPAGDGLDALFERATSAAVPGRKITYKLLRPDFFVITGETATGKFYRRLAVGPAGLRGFSIGYDKAMAATVDRYVIGIASSFEPFPSGPLPATAGGAIANVGAAAGGVRAPVVPAVVRPTERHGVGLAVSDRLVLTAAIAIDGCKTLKVSGAAARLKQRDDGGLALLERESPVAGAAPGLSAEALTERADVVLVAYSDDGGKRVAMALPGQSLRIGASAAVFAPLQPGQAGAPVFDRQGRLAGLVTANPSDKMLIAGVAPQRAYAVADSAALQAFAARAGLSLASAPAGAALSTGAVVEKIGKAAVPVVCGL